MDIKKRFCIAIAGVLFLILILETMLHSFIQESAYWRVGQDIILVIAIYLTIRFLFYDPFRKITNELQNLVSDENKSIHQRIEIPIKLGEEITKPVNKLLSRQETILNDIADSVARIQPMTEELRDTYSSMSEKATMQNNHSQVLEQSIGRIQEVTQSVSEQVTEITATTEESHKATEQAAQSMIDTVTSINDLAQDINTASNEMSVLKEVSDKIHTILEVITGISEQTNLLALNAAIEAARAGEHGRGFAVVADEVRTLAERTRSSANEVDQMIGDLQSGTSRVVDAMAVSIQKTEETVAKTEKSHQQLNLIQQQISHVDLLAHNVQSSMDEQVSAGEEANQSVQSMAQLNEEALKNTAIQAVTPDDLMKFFHTILDKFEQHGFERTDWATPRREGIREE